jgi:hypothetical protein
MDIVYIARHHSGDNDDEGAITHALRQLGHRVVRLPETCSVEQVKAMGGDFVLFHKWDHADIYRIPQPKVFWYFDLTLSDDPQLSGRMRRRRDWIHRVLPHCVLGFCTDGDLVDADKSGKLRWLMQGADERKVGLGSPLAFHSPLLFTGIVRGGAQRQHHVDLLKQTYGDDLLILGANGRAGRKHGRELADIIASCAVVIAPIGPSTDHYWSNRVYLTLGFGGFLVHPLCGYLNQHYLLGDELVVYRTEEESIAMIDYFLKRPEERQAIAERGYLRTVANHLYRHRCEELVAEVRRVL